jgi:hypothetical protein
MRAPLVMQSTQATEYRYRLHLGHDIMNVVKAKCVDNDAIGDNGNHAHSHRRDKAGETHTTRRCPEKIGVTFGRDVKHSSWRHKSERMYVLRKGPINVVILPVHISGQCSGQCDLAGARRDGNEPALRD